MQKQEDIKCLPRPWVDRIFLRLKNFYGDAIDDSENEKNNWAVVLGTLTAEEIKQALEVCEDYAEKKLYPPHVLDFYNYAKYAMPPPKKITIEHEKTDRQQSNPNSKNIPTARSHGRNYFNDW